VVILATTPVDNRISRENLKPLTEGVLAPICSERQRISIRKRQVELTLWLPAPS
jgi:hypothetical protein